MGTQVCASKIPLTNEAWNTTEFLGYPLENPQIPLGVSATFGECRVNN